MGSDNNGESRSEAETSVQSARWQRVEQPEQPEHSYRDATNVMNQLDFNALMDGRTGLTPTNILTPIMVNMTTSSSSSSSGLLQTPTVSTPSCGSQQRTNRSTVLQELGSPNTGGH